MTTRTTRIAPSSVSSLPPRPPVAVVGLGYVGLPLAVAFAEAGYDVIGLEADSTRVDALNAGTSHIGDVPDARLAAVAPRLLITSDPLALGPASSISICVPTPLGRNREPDLALLERATRTLASVLVEGQLVVVESTSFPGTTRDHVLPILEVGSGLRAGVDFALGYSPERIDPGNETHGLRTTPKLVAGLTQTCVERVRALYEVVCDEVVVVASPEVAEMAKLLENVFRTVNIALVNELTVLAERMGIDVIDVIDAAATKPYGFMRFEPGPGMGGHCLPVDPFYLSWKAREFGLSMEFIELAGRVNQQMPEHCVQKVVEALNADGRAARGARVLVLGVAYKAGVADIRESPSLAIIDRLQRLGAEVNYHDPHVPALTALGLESVELDEGVAAADLAVVVTAHPSVDHHAVAGRLPVVDLRGVLRGPAPVAAQAVQAA